MTTPHSQTMVLHGGGGGGGRYEGVGGGPTPLPTGGVTRRMFSRPRLENGGRKSVLSHMLFNKL